MLFDVAATINTSQCIGCARCIKACPVDAIIGAPKRLHQILPSYCTGCEDCVAVCPVDCIDLVTTDYCATERTIREQIGDERTQVQLEKRAIKTKRTIEPSLTDDAVIQTDLAAILSRAKEKQQSRKSQQGSTS